MWMSQKSQNYDFVDFSYISVVFFLFIFAFIKLPKAGSLCFSFASDLWCLSNKIYGYLYCTTSFNKVLNKFRRRFKSCWLCVRCLQ